VPSFLGDKIWGKLFDCASETVLVTFVPKSAECAIAGIGLQHSFKEHDKKGNQYYDKQTVDTLGVMRGRPFDILASGGTWHVFKWVTNHEDCYKYLETSAANMEKHLNSFAIERLPLQGWNSQCTWIPLRSA